MQLHRLRDLQDPVAPELAAARDLLRTTGPLEPSLARMQRVRQALMAQVPAPAPAGISLLVKATLLLLAAGVAAGLFFLTRGSRQPRSEPPARRPSISLPSTAAVITPPAPPAAEPLRAPVPPIHLGEKNYRHPSAAGPHAAGPLRAPVPPIHLGGNNYRPPSAAGQRAVAAVAQPARPDEVPAVAPPAPLAAKDPTPAPAVEIPEEVDPAEASLVLSATQVLRQRGEPARALSLLSEYQRRFPQGALQEEALALNLECLVALSDERAGPQAREYLKRYPRGRFRTFAAATAARYPASRPLKE